MIVSFTINSKFEHINQLHIMKKIVLEVEDAIGEAYLIASSEKQKAN